MTNLFNRYQAGAGMVEKDQSDYCQSPGSGGSDQAITLEVIRRDHILDAFWSLRQDDFLTDQMEKESDQGPVYVFWPK